MMATLLADTFEAESTANRQRRHGELLWWMSYLAVVTTGLMIAAVAYVRSDQLYFGISLTCLVLLWATWIRFPRVGLGLTVGFALVGDLVTVSWFPFNKNLSSVESVMYFADSISISPLELTTVLGLGVAAYRNVAATGRPFRSSALNRPFLLFSVFLLLGLGLGLNRGGDTRAAIYEIRPLILLPLMYLLIVNVCTSRQDYRRMIWAAGTAIVIQSILSLVFLSTIERNTRDQLDSLNEHGSAISANLLLVMLVTSFTFRRSSGVLRTMLLVALGPIGFVYIIAERRAAIVALVAAMLLLAIVLFWRQRRTFWKVVPIAIVIALGYLGAFWNSQSSAGFPAQAVKAVIAPDQISLADQSSDQYRMIENFDLFATIRSAPLTGIGFGRPFLRPIPLPDISVFEFNQYVPHNSLLWIWTKLGFLGFATTLYLLARTIMLGAARLRPMPTGTDAVVAFGAMSFVVMYAIYLYLDIAWEPRNLILLALSMGLCTGPLDDEPRRDRLNPRAIA